jgi:hypothetical protein
VEAKTLVKRSASGVTKQTIRNECAAADSLQTAGEGGTSEDSTSKDA